jgi:hypothetical protein
MKVCVLAAALCLVIHCAAAASSLRRSFSSFGPGNCVQISRSSANSCVISTDCEGADLSKTEFAFNCVDQRGGVVRHSFGVGGFEANEEFDTEISCKHCFPPSAVRQQHQQKRKQAPIAQPKVEVAPNNLPRAAIFRSKRRASQQQEVTAVADSSAQARYWPGSETPQLPLNDVVRYGPNDCVSTYKSSEGHCIMKTDCKARAIKNYEFGLVCVDKTGSPVRHLFGKDSFDPQETFDTLLKCDQCLGLEDIPDAIALNGEVDGMAQDISKLKKMMTTMTKDVANLNQKVFPPAPAPAPAPGPAKAPKKAKPAKFLVHKRRHHGHKKHHGRHAHKRHHHRRHEDDDDDDDDNYDDDDNEEDDEDKRSEAPAVQVAQSDDNAEQAQVVPKVEQQPAPVAIDPVAAAAAINFAMQPKQQAQEDDDDDDDDDRDLD